MLQAAESAPEIDAARVIREAADELLVEFVVSGACKAMEPVLEDLVDTYPELRLVKVDADANEAAMDDFGVQSIPTLILFEDSDPVDVSAGKAPYPTIERAVEERI